MSADTNVLPAQLPEGHGRPTWPSLIGAELLRLRSRRLFAWALIGALAIMVVSVIGAFVGSGEPTAADRAAAAQQAIQIEAECRESLKNEIPPGELDQACRVSADDFLTTQPFTWASGYRDGVFAVAVGFAALMFLIGASAGGAEWGARTLPALLYWEPRRVRVLVAKCVALGVVAAAVSLAAQVLWLIAGFALEATRGPAVPSELPDGFWTEILGIAGRGAVLAVLMTLVAFGIANLTRNTAAALGVAFVYFAILENLIGFLRPGLLRWQINSNAIALLTPGGFEVPAGGSPEDVFSGQAMEMILIGNARAGLWLATIAGLVLLVATVVFVRRDAA
jgi:hypothetical protein